MRRLFFFCTPALGLAACALAACSGDDSTATPDAGHDATSSDTGTPDTWTPPSDSGHDSASRDAATPDSAPGDAGADTSNNPDASDAACPVAWTTAPAVDSTIAVPADGGGVLLHAGGNGTQDYTCKLVTLADGGSSYAWTFVGPEADLSDCNGAKIGQHFASDGGPTAPEWQTTDGTYVIGKKLAAFTPDGGASAVPWLLLQATSTGGAGVLSKTAYVQRLNTTGGVTPATTCDVAHEGNTEKVTYTADYFYFGGP